MRIKKFTLIRKLASLSEEAFRSHWKGSHGALVAGLPVFWKYTDRYVQNHPVKLRAPFPAEFDYDGVVESWQRPRPDMRVALNDDPDYLRYIRPDEDRFVDVSRSTIVYAEERVMLDGPETAIKYLAFVRRRLDLTQEQFSQYWQERHAAFALGTAAFGRYVRRYVQNHGRAELSRGMTRSGYTADFAGVTQLWFDSVSDAESFFSDPEFVATASADEANFISLPTFGLIAQAHEFFPPS